MIGPVHARERVTRQSPQGVRAPGRAPAERLEDDLFNSLQRSVGNRAVTLLVQRAPKDRSAPTDAPGAKKAPKKGPKEAPARASDFKARIIGLHVVGGKTVITIANGDRPAQAGMPGSLLEKRAEDRPEAEYEDFFIDSVKGGTCTAFVSATMDRIKPYPYVNVKASKYEPPPTGEGGHA